MQETELTTRNAMNREQVETAFAKTMEHILEVVGNTTADYLPILGGKSIELTISSLEEYLKLMKELQQDYEKTTTNYSCMSPMLNDSMLVHRSRLSRTSKSRLTVFRTSPEGVRSNGSPMEVDRQNLSMTHIGSIAEESTLIDPTIMMDETTHQRGFLADVSDMNGTVRSRLPSFSFNYISPVPSEKTLRRSSVVATHNTVRTSSIDFDADVSSLVESTRTISIRKPRVNADEDGNVSVVDVTNDELRTPRAQNATIDLTDSDTTPISLNLWNVKLRPGSNRKIDNEIRKEIQRQLARESSPSDQ